MRFVALRVAVAGLVVADDGVIEIGHVDRAVGPLTHVHGAEGVVRRAEQHGHLRAPKAGTRFQDPMHLHFARHESGDHRAALRVVGQRLRADQIDGHALHVGLKHRAHAVVVVGRESVCGPHQAGLAVVAGRAVPGLVKNLAPIIRDHAPAIGSRPRLIEKAIEPQRARTQPPEAGLIETLVAPRRLHVGADVQPLRKPE